MADDECEEWVGWIDLPPKGRGATIESENSSSTMVYIDSLASLAIRDVVRYGEFHRGWDGYDGEAFAQDTVDKAIVVIRSISESFKRAGSRPSEITPGPISDGRIDIEAVCEERQLIVTVETGTDQIGIFYDNGRTYESIAGWESDHLERWIRRVTGEDRMSSRLRDPDAFACR